MTDAEFQDRERRVTQAMRQEVAQCKASIDQAIQARRLKSETTSKRESFSDFVKTTLYILSLPVLAFAAGCAVWWAIAVWVGTLFTGKERL